MTLSLRRIAIALPVLVMLAACGGDDTPAAETKAGAATTPAPAAGTVGTAAAPQDAEPAAEPVASGGSITSDDLRRYRLSMDRIRRLQQAEAEWRRSGGKAQENDESVDMGKNPTLADAANQMMRQLEKDPKILAALRSAGLSAREVAIHTMVAGGSAMAAGGMAQPEIAPENVEFIKAHRAELEAMQR
ncbi:MAG TPA: hypothetical protein VNP72_10020, partial [Longimicrobium sp.]|nr:hypothetical protein [Longimicrobium sp.]